MNEKKKATLAAPDNSDCKDTQKNDCGAKSDLVSKELNDFDKGLDTAEATELEECRVYNSANIPAPEPIIEKDGIPIFSKGDFSILVGNPGTRKSWLCASIAAAFINDDGFLGFNRVSANGVLLWVDTEQGRARTAQSSRRLNKMLGFSENKDLDFLVLLDFRDKDFEKRKSLLVSAIEIHNPQFVILDGLADLITDPNDPKQSCEIVLLLMQITAKYNIHILAVVHSNVGANDKARGHLGSEALRKCETAIYCKVSPDGEFTVCTYQKTRNKRPQDFGFNICDGIPTLCDYSPEPISKTKEAKILFSDLLTNEPETRYLDLVSSIKSKTGQCEKTAKNKIRYALKNGVIAQGANGLYYLPKREETPF